MSRQLLSVPYPTASTCVCVQWESSPVPGAVVTPGVVGVTGAGTVGVTGTGTVGVTGAGTVGVTGALVVTGTGAAVATGTVMTGSVTPTAGAARVVVAKANKDTSSTAVHHLWDFIPRLASVSRCRLFTCSVPAGKESMRQCRTAKALPLGE